MHNVGLFKIQANIPHNPNISWPKNSKKKWQFLSDFVGLNLSELHQKYVIRPKIGSAKIMGNKATKLVQTISKIPLTIIL